MSGPLNGSVRSCQCFKRVRLADAVHIKISASPFQKPTSPNGKNYHTSPARYSNPESSLKPSNRQWSKSATQIPVSHSVKNARVSLSRTRRQSSSMSAPKGLHRAIVAFGGNIGDTVAHIENALHSLRENGIRIIKLSKLYRTQPMYVEDQAPFLNGVALIETTLKPIELLDLLQKTENEQGRVRKIAKGPRTLDLDIILYDNEQINYERLQVPHPLMMEREFVLRPLADVMEAFEQLAVLDDKKPEYKTTVQEALQKVSDPAQPIFPVACMSRNGLCINAALVNPSRTPTQIMSILNITPDSFSDGGKLNPNSIDDVVATARSHIASGANILDIGGQSTRPNATFISAEDELERILPALKAIARIPQVQSGKVSISIDTFHAPVVRACIEQGLADIINDVTGGVFDPDMLATAAQLRKPIILMHMRGTPRTMTSKEMTDYTRIGGVVSGVAQELAERVQAALDAGIPPWRIMLDPGIGFAKDIAGNLGLLRAGPQGLVNQQPGMLAGYPWLVGTSRKGFIGKITGVEKAEGRSWGTAACVTASVATGADVVRVHDIAEMTSVVKMADSIYRRPLG